MEKDRRQRPRLEIYARSRSPGVHALRIESYLLCPKKVPGRPPLCLVEGTRGRRLVPKQLRFSPLKIRLRRWSIRHDDDRPRSTHSHTHKICASLTLASLDQASAGRAADETLPRFSLWLCSKRNVLLCGSPRGEPRIFKLQTRTISETSAISAVETRFPRIRSSKRS